MKDNKLRKLLKSLKTIVIIGASANPVKASFFVGKYFILRGVKIIPINPKYEGEKLWGEKFLKSIKDIDSQTNVDMVDIFRPSNEVYPIVKESIKYLKPLGCKTIWMQMGIKNQRAAKEAKKNDLNVIMNKCPKIEYQRLFGELRVAGFNTGIISSKIDL